MIAYLFVDPPPDLSDMEFAWIDCAVDSSADLAKARTLGWELMPTYIIRNDPCPIYSGPPAPDFVELTEKERLRLEHKAACQKAYSRPPKRMGRGYSPPKKWGVRPHTHSIRRGGRDW